MSYYLQHCQNRNSLIDIIVNFDREQLLKERFSY